MAKKQVKSGKFLSKPQSKLNLKLKESSRCQIFTDFINHYFSMSTIHGFYHIAAPRRHPVETVIWIGVVIAAVFGTYKVTSVTIARYTQSPTVISMERDRFSWNTSFPAATICPTFKVDEDKLDIYVEESSAKNKTYFKLFLRSLAEAGYSTFDKVLPYDDLDSKDYLDLVLKLKFSFKPSVTNSGTGSQFYLKQLITEMGICYSFNSELAVYNSPK